MGDRVPLSKKHFPFKKGYLPGWMEEILIVMRVVRGLEVTYKLEEWDIPNGDADAPGHRNPRQASNDRLKIDFLRTVTRTLRCWRGVSSRMCSRSTTRAGFYITCVDEPKDLCH